MIQKIYNFIAGYKSVFGGALLSLYFILQIDLIGYFGVSIFLVGIIDKIIRLIVKKVIQKKRIEAMKREVFYMVLGTGKEDMGEVKHIDVNYPRQINDYESILTVVECPKNIGLIEHVDLDVMPWNIRRKIINDGIKLTWDYLKDYTTLETK